MQMNSHCIQKRKISIELINVNLEIMFLFASNNPVEYLLTHFMISCFLEALFIEKLGLCSFWKRKKKQTSFLFFSSLTKKSETKTKPIDVTCKTH